MSEPVRVFLVSPAVAIRRALARALDAEAEIVVVGEASSSTTAVARIPAARPAVVLAGAQHQDPPELCRLILGALPGVQVLLVALKPDQAMVAAAISAGAAGVLPHTVDEDELVEAIETAAAGRMVVSTATFLHILNDRAGPAVKDPVAGLTPLEKELFALVGEGLTNAEIAERLRLSPGTVRNYVSRLLRKLEVDRRAQVVALAARRVPQPRPHG